MPIETGDTSRTPTVGGGSLPPPKLSIIDAANLLTEMKSAIEKAQEDDPKFLRARIAELEKAAGTRSSLAAAAASPVVVQAFDRARSEELVLRAGKSYRERKESVIALVALADGVAQAADALVEQCKQAVDELEGDKFAIDLEEFFDASEATLRPPPGPTTQARAPRRTETPKVITKATQLDRNDANTSDLPRGDAAVLAVAFQYGLRGAPTAAVALMTGLKARTIQNSVVRLRAHPSGALVERDNGRLVITPAGEKLVPAGTKPFPRGKALVQQLIKTLPDGESKLLAMALDAHPKPISTSEIAEHTPYATRTVQNLIVRLVSRLAIARAAPGQIKNPSGGVYVSGPLNPWLDIALSKAGRLFEDSDRKAFAVPVFYNLIRRAHRLATVSAHVAPEPKLERLQLDEGVLLSLEWLDEESGWYLMLGIRRKPGEKLREVLEFSGEQSYATDKPTVADITKAMHDYFQAWQVSK